MLKPRNAGFVCGFPGQKRAMLWVRVQTLMSGNIALTGQVNEARANSVRIELLLGMTIQDLGRQVKTLKAALPRWYEKPTTVAFVTMLVTIWSVLKVVSISI